MIKKAARYYYAIKHLKLIQIRFQIWYRIRNRFFPVKYSSCLESPKIQQIKLQSFPKQHTHYLKDKHFEFLNLEVVFKNNIDWNYIPLGKLWSYHLNYFDFLHQPEMDWGTGESLIDDFLGDISKRHEGMEPYPISLRTINWIKFLSSHKQFPQRIVNSIYSQYKMLERKIEYHLLGNHLLENGFSILFGAVFFSDERLENLARKILSKELEEQILDDGAHFELSPMYHVILLQRALDSYNILAHNKHGLEDIQKQLQEKICKMSNWLYTISFKNGDIPMLNDSVSGQALDTIKVLDYARELGFLPEKCNLEDSGYRKFEWDNFELIIDAGKVGPSYQPGHAHSDTMSFVLQYKKEPILIDTGISTYEKNERRQFERSTEAHNTVVINGKDQTDVWGGFRVGKRAKAKIHKEDKSSLIVSHDGYKNIGCDHKRSWNALDNRLEIRDEILGPIKFSFAYFHFHPSLSVKEMGNGIYKIGNLRVEFSGYTSIEIQDYLFSAGFNNQKEAKLLQVQFRKRLETNIFI